MNRIVALDIGDVRIGVAVSDLLRVVANGRETYTRKGLEQDIEYFTEYAKRENANLFVLGLPVNMDGTEGIRVQIVREFGDKLEEVSGIKVEYEDERLTTVMAEEMLIEANVRRDKRKKVIDKVAACIILQAYLDSNKR